MNDGEPIFGLGLVKETVGVKKFDIIGAKDVDSLGGDSWKEYLTSQKLLEVWGVHRDSPYYKFQKTKTINAIDDCSDKMQPRYSEGEVNSEYGIKNLIMSGVLDKSTAIILDSGGAHSVAMAVKLAEIGYQPVIMLDSGVVSFLEDHGEQDLAVMIYFTKQLEKIKNKGKFHSDSPPVFVMDTHRSSGPTYSYNDSDLPTYKELQKNRIKKVIYFNENDNSGEFIDEFQSIERLSPDLKDIVKAWQANGIEIAYTGVTPWSDNNSCVSELTSDSGHDRNRFVKFYLKGDDHFSHPIKDYSELLGDVSNSFVIKGVKTVGISCEDFNKKDK